MSQDWRIGVTGQDFLGAQKKKNELEQRRPVVRRPRDLAGMGPGISGQAIRISNFNDALATYNGYFSATGSASNKPGSGSMFVGYVISDSDLGGVQVFTDLGSGVTYRRTFVRAPADPETLSWTNWV